MCRSQMVAHGGDSVKVSRVQHGVQSVCYMYDRMCSAHGGADLMCVKDSGSKTWHVLQKTGFSGMHLPLPLPTLPSHAVS